MSGWSVCEPILPEVRMNHPQNSPSTFTWPMLWLSLWLASVVAALGAPALAQGRGVEVTQEQLDDAFINLRATLATQGRAVAENQRSVVERQMVEKLALTQLLMGKATEAEKKTAREKVEKLVEDQKAKARSPARFEAQIRSAGLSPETFEKQLLERAVCEEVLARELRPRLGVTEAKVRAFYDDRAQEFQRPERVRLRQLVLSLKVPGAGDLSAAEQEEKRALARKFRERIVAGESLEKLAREFSDDPGGRERGGEYVFPAGQMVVELESAVSLLPINRLSEVIETPYSLHLVEVLERLPGEKVPFEKVSEGIRARLELEATEALLPKYQEELFTAAGVTFHMP
jgi:peptidyl-prolyl cis-trans isomerase C